mgnify:CR=1 FL=1
MGGGWDKVDLTVANDISEDTVILNLEVDLPDGLTNEEKKQLKIILFQKTDSEGRTIKDDSRAKYEIDSSIIEESINEPRYLPLGKYGLNFNLPEGYKVIVKGNFVDNEISSEKIPKDVPPKPQPSPDATAIAEAISSLGNSEMPEEIQKKKSEPNLFLGDYTKPQFESLKLVIEKK